LLVGPGREPVRGAGRENAALTAVRGFVVDAATSGRAPGHLLPLISELADDRDLPEQARSENPSMAWRMRARDRLVVLLMARAGLRREELCGLRRGDVHLLADSASHLGR